MIVENNRDERKADVVSATKASSDETCYLMRCWKAISRISTVESLPTSILYINVVESLRKNTTTK